MTRFDQRGQHVDGHQYNADLIVVNEGFPHPSPPLNLHQLPLDELRFTGRADDMAEVLACLDRANSEHGATVAISAIAGMAGVGKSTLAIHAAHAVKHRFPDAQLYIDLRGSDGAPLAPLEVLGRFLRSLGVAHLSIPEDVQERAALFRSLLASTFKRTLVLLDNAYDTAQVEPLRPASATCALIITSRHRLDSLDGAHMHILDVMKPGEAVQLLEQLLSEERVAVDSDSVSHIARLCGRLPLALRIAGGQLSRNRHLPLADYVRRLSDEQQRLDQLYLDHKEVRSSFELSYRDLLPASARLFRLLGRLPSAEFGDEEVACLIGGPSGTLGCSDVILRRALDPLISECLVEVIGPHRYRLHDLLRLFAREQLDKVERRRAQDEAWRRVVLWYAEASRMMGESLQTEVLEDVRLPEGQTCVVLEEGQTLFLRALNWFDTEYDNLKAAIDDVYKHKQWEYVWLLASHMLRYLDLRALWADWQWSQGLALSASRAAGNRQVEAAVLINLGNLFQRQRRWEEAHAHYMQSLTLYRAIGDRTGESTVLSNLSSAFAECGLWDEARRSKEEALAIRHEMGDDADDAATLINTATIFAQQGQWDQAIAIYEANLQLARELGNRHREALILMNLGTVRDRQGDHATALELYRDSMQILQQLGDRHNENNVLFNMGLAYLQQDAILDAIECLERAVEICRDLDDRLGEFQGLMQLSVVYEQNDDLDKAGALRRVAEVLMTQAGQ